MSVLDTIGDFFKSLHRKPGVTTDLDTRKILDTIDNTTIAVQNIFIAVAYLDALKDITQRIQQRRFNNTNTNKQLTNVYGKFTKALNPRLAGVETHLALSTFGKIGTTVAKDLRLLTQNFNKIFGTYTDVETMRVSHGYVLGYLVLANKMCDWFNSFIFLVDIPDNDKPPGYHLARLEQDATIVASFMNSIERRLANVDIMTEIKGIQDKGTDVALYVNGSSINEYANESDYTSGVVTSLNGLVNPILMLGTKMILHKRAEYEKRKQEREWLSAKVSLLRYNQQGVDVNSVEYKKAEKALSVYTQIITNLDAKIAEYERN